MSHYHGELLDASAILVFIDSFCQNLGLESVEVDQAALVKVKDHIRKHEDTITSLFKLLGHFVCAFSEFKPLKTAFSKKAISEELCSIENHQNAILAFELCRHALSDACFRFKDNEETLKVSDLSLSRSYYIDLIKVLSDVDTKRSPFAVALIFESLVYSQPLIIERTGNAFTIDSNQRHS